MYPDVQQTNSTQYFFPEWVTGIFYGGQWHDIKPQSFKEGIPTDHGSMAVYLDAFSEEMVFLTEPITGFRVKKPEPKASVTHLRPKK